MVGGRVLRLDAQPLLRVICTTFYSFAQLSVQIIDISYLGTYAYQLAIYDQWPTDAAPFSPTNSNEPKRDRLKARISG